MNTLKVTCTLTHTPKTNKPSDESLRIKTKSPKRGSGLNPNRRYKTVDTIEKRLKDYQGYQGYQVYKIIDNKGTRQEKITYMLNDQEENNINCFSSLAELKKWADS